MSACCVNAICVLLCFAGVQCCGVVCNGISVLSLGSLLDSITNQRELMQHNLGRDQTSKEDMVKHPRTSLNIHQKISCIKQGGAGLKPISKCLKKFCFIPPYAKRVCIGQPRPSTRGLLSTWPNPSSFYVLVDMLLTLHLFPAYSG